MALERLLSLTTVLVLAATLPAEAFENLLVVSTTAALRKVESLVGRRGGDPATVGVVFAPVRGTSDGKINASSPATSTQRCNAERFSRPGWPPSRRSPAVWAAVAAA